jgi:DNA-binding LacI/PurR family transcriptional regulator
MDEPVTLEQVAQAAGVSRSTASRVINGGIASPQSARAVNRAVKKLGFVPNRAARTLARQRTDAVALVTPESPALLFLDPFIAAVTSTLASCLWRAGLQPLLALMDPDDPVATTKLFLHRGNVDGIIVTHFQHNEQIEALLAASQLPAVFIGRPPSGTDAPYVDADNVHGGYIAAKHLLDRGRRHIACLGGPLSLSSAADRRSGFLQAHAEAGVTPGPYIELPFRGGAPAAAAAQLLADYPEVDAIVAQSDALAAGAVQALASAGRAMPDEVAVVGYDDSATTTPAVPALTTVTQPIGQLAAGAAKLIIDRLKTGEWGETPPLFPTQLVIRQSA